MRLSDDGVSVKLHQTLIQGSAAPARRPRRLWDVNPTPEKLIRTPAPAPQNGGLGRARRPSQALARREGSHTADEQHSPLLALCNRKPCRGPIQAAGSGAQASARAQDSRSTTRPRTGRSPVVGPSSASSSPVRSGCLRHRGAFAEPSRRTPPDAFTWRRNAGRRRPPACAAGGRRCGPAAPPTSPTPAPCRASSRGGPATSWPARSRAGTGRRLRRRPT